MQCKGPEGKSRGTCTYSVVTSYFWFPLPYFLDMILGRSVVFRAGKQGRL